MKGNKFAVLLYKLLELIKDIVLHLFL